MSERFSRTELLLGKEALAKLKKSRVAVFGLGGVGSYVVEALARSGIGKIGLIDNDRVCPTNINRQIYATTKTIGRYKTDVAKERLLEINPDIQVKSYNLFYSPQNADEFDFGEYDYIVDAIDTVTGKISLIEQAKINNVSVICSMGTGNKLDPTRFEVADISKTSVCPLARVIRTELKKRNIKDVKVVFSKEIPVKPAENVSLPVEESENVKKQPPASCAFVPSVAGLIIAGEVIKDLIRK